MNLLRYTLVLSVSAGLFMGGCVSQKPAVANASGVTLPEPAEASAPAEHADLSGNWDYTMTNEQQESITGILTIQKGGSAGYTGRISTNEINLDSETSITKAQLTGSNFVYEGVVKSPEGDIPFVITGTIKGNQMEGRNAVRYQGQDIAYKVKATRK